MHLWRTSLELKHERDTKAIFQLNMKYQHWKYSTRSLPKSPNNHAVVIRVPCEVEDLQTSTSKSLVKSLHNAVIKKQVSIQKRFLKIIPLFSYTSSRMLKEISFMTH